LNGMFPWIKHTPKSSPSQNADDVTTNDQLLNGRAASVKNASLKRIKKFGHFFEIYGRFLTLRPVKMGVLVTTGVLLGASVWGNVLLRQEFDPMWFLPKDSYLSLYVEQNDK